MQTLSVTWGDLRHTLAHKLRPSTGSTLRFIVKTRKSAEWFGGIEIALQQCGRTIVARSETNRHAPEFS